MKELEIAAQEELMHSYSSSTVIISTYGESARIEKCESFFFSQEAMINMFRKGAEWQAKQSPWISVKERLPEEKQRVLVVRNSGLICESCCNLRNKSWLIYGFGYVYDVVVWMPIPSFDEILEANRDVLERIKEKGD
ncbi:DUF551 domain-containing protein [Bacteroides finegoldii]|jgi:hypothetical protein|uniref:DUF551 domain-containing protein n=1 Tax=Bacteroides finegoldii TaxID=338188 RepID=UPI001E2C4DB0|nr:DUF551 domain-containing protein [Bacteroides finegoldii]